MIYIIIPFDNCNIKNLLWISLLLKPLCYPSSKVFEVHRKTYKARSLWIFFMPKGILHPWKGKTKHINNRNKLAKKKKGTRITWYIILDIDSSPTQFPVKYFWGWLHGLFVAYVTIKNQFMFLYQTLGTGSETLNNMLLIMSTRYW